ncbi:MULTISPECIES: AMIN domain-containing protein [Cyanophyceae]|uniref:AMIN domain-containing protein n=1 Tax=Cyanophyceae TaxID=3028117 RepID=UPI0016898D91|nr:MULTISPECIES: AMIN domain-containing protein [Cyanophyceae]MBD1916513.1 AMIN domain-containing protein [Phormidium sp. FACHB-77]MBD2032080.1 AMIN domain-containing protein [Phormidium sp. FACHB-322]MBD2052960.1 AMIN domain-containing protein [Leptolyngbya sp. FACHB-60]
MEHPIHHSAASRTGYRLGGWAGAGLMVSTLLIISPAAQAETLAAWQFDPATQQLTFTLPSGITPQYTVAANASQIVVTLPQTQLGTVATQQTYSGAVSQVSLSQVNDATVVVLDLVADTVLAAEEVRLISIAAGDQTRWVLTASAAAPMVSTPSSTPAPGSSSMIVELPVIPGNDPRLGFPEAGTGRLSTSAANLMLPSDIASLTNLPETLPVDPFNLGQPGEQISVPSLAELDAVIGPVATAPQGPSSASTEPPIAGAPQAGAIAPLPAVQPPASTGSVLTFEPPSLAEGAVPRAAQPSVAAAPTSSPEAVATQPASPPTSPAAPAIDTETSGVPIAVTPPELPTPGQPAVEAEAIAAAPTPATPVEASNPTPVIAADPPALPELPAETTTAAPTTAPAVEASNLTPVIASDPPALPELPAETAMVETQPAGAIAVQPDAISQEPPPVATVPVELAGTDPNLLTVPTAPTTTSQGTVIPPSSSPVMLAAARETVLFGSPLPGNGDQAALPSAINPASSDRPLSPDTLVAAGTVLELRYVGDEPLGLNASSSQNQVLLLAHDIRDPITNGIVAPAGSQLIGQFEPTPEGQRWVSKMLIAPNGQQVDFASTTEYMVGNTEVSSPRLAAGTGLGALALLLLTGFSGIGLLGGALVGATTVVGTSPQYVVIEPNQVIQVQVIQDIPRAIPIAAAPETSREWGSGGW